MGLPDPVNSWELTILYEYKAQISMSTSGLENFCLNSLPQSADNTEESMKHINAISSFPNA